MDCCTKMPVYNSLCPSSQLSNTSHAQLIIFKHSRVCLLLLCVYTAFIPLDCVSLKIKTERSFLQVPSLFSSDSNWRLRVLSCVFHCLVTFYCSDLRDLWGGFSLDLCSRASLWMHRHSSSSSDRISSVVLIPWGSRLKSRRGKVV